MSFFEKMKTFSAKISEKIDVVKQKLDEREKINHEKKVSSLINEREKIEQKASRYMELEIERKRIDKAKKTLERGNKREPMFAPLTSLNSFSAKYSPILNNKDSLPVKNKRTSFSAVDSNILYLGVKKR